jgi:hypothetical protein
MDDVIVWLYDILQRYFCVTKATCYSVSVAALCSAGNGCMSHLEVLLLLGCDLP